MHANRFYAINRMEQGYSIEKWNAIIDIIIITRRMNHINLIWWAQAFEEGKKDLICRT